MKPIRLFPVLLVVSLASVGCLHTANHRNPSVAAGHGGDDPNAHSIFHDYDYNGQGDVVPYPTVLPH